MTVLKILTYPEPVLSQKAEEVKVFDQELATLLDNMGETMYHDAGIGLAANQVGVLKRVVVVDISRDKWEKIEFVNPVITQRSGKMSYEEGCLSVPEFRDTVERSKEIVVRAQDRNGKEFELKASDLMAVCLQHEIDHLDGVLFIERLSRLKRQLFKRWHKKHMSTLEESALK